MRLLHALFITLLLSIPLHSAINPVQTMQELEAYYKNANSETLAIFDIDYTLIQPAEAAFQAGNISRFQSVQREILQKLAPQKRDVLINLINTQTQATLVSPTIPQFLATLLKRNIPFMGLTKDLTGPLGEIDNLENWKVRILDRLGINFSNGAPIKDKIVFTSLPSFRGNYPAFTNGILFTNGTGNKGRVLVQFLRTFCLAPQKVIFADYEESNLTDVEAALKELNSQIEFQGLLFMGAQQVPAQKISEQQFREQWEQMAKLAERTQ